MSGLMAKSREAAASARVLFEAGHYDGCANRAYYAMFDAARAYLKVRHDLDLGSIRTHGGILRMFSKRAVLEDGLSPDLARMLNRVAAQRTRADYDEEGVVREAAAEILEDMARFLAGVLDPLEKEDRS